MRERVSMQASTFESEAGAATETKKDVLNSAIAQAGSFPPSGTTFESEGK